MQIDDIFMSAIERRRDSNEKRFHLLNSFILYVSIFKNFQQSVRIRSTLNSFESRI